MPRAAALLLPVLLLAGCAQGFAPPPPPPGARSSNPQVVAACRAQAASIITRQDRGQLIREDERNSRLGSETTGSLAFRAPIDRLSREYRFEQMVDECVRANARDTAPAATAAPPPGQAGR
ncbi:MAG TPA: hypothetical protein VGN96_05085 [Roseococcus sp.]|jgi:hypothetical protein|nr:hypothetical protein [Roseococcus sp.]